MLSNMTKIAQQATVGQGLAAGCVAIGRPNIPGNSLTLSLDFRRAWRDWAHAELFPAVKTVDRKDGIHNILSMSERRQGHLAAWRNAGTVWVPYLEGDRTPAEVAEALQVGLPLEGWEQLAAGFTGRL